MRWMTPGHLKRYKVKGPPYIFTNIPVSHISVCFALETSALEQNKLKTAKQKFALEPDLKSPFETNKVKRTLCYM